MKGYHFGEKIKNRLILVDWVLQFLTANCFSILPSTAKSSQNFMSIAKHVNWAIYCSQSLIPENCAKPLQNFKTKYQDQYFLFKLTPEIIPFKIKSCNFDMLFIQ